MQRVRIRYTKEGRVRFVSARDLTSVWERALRRVDLPIAYSEGFHPHPKVSFPDALPVGVSSTGEYAELTFAAPIDPGPALRALSATLPQGMDILAYRVVDERDRKLARTLAATLWELEYPSHAESDVISELRAAVDAILAADHVTVTKTSPQGDRKEIDLRPSLLALHAQAAPSPDPTAGAAAPASTTSIARAILHNDGPSVRPLDLHDAILASRRGEEPRPARSSSPDGPALPPPRVTRRVAQGDATEAGLVEALSGELIPLATDVPATVAVGIAS